MSEIFDLFKKIASTSPKVSVNEDQDIDAAILEEPVLSKPIVMPPKPKPKVIPVIEEVKEVTPETFESVSDIMRNIQKQTRLTTEEQVKASRPVDMQEDIINALTEKMFGKGGPPSNKSLESKIGKPKPKNKITMSPSVKEAVSHQVINVRTKELVHTAPTHETAKRHAARKDMEFGRIIHAIRKVKEDVDTDQPKTTKKLKHNGTVKPVGDKPKVTKQDETINLENGIFNDDEINKLAAISNRVIVSEKEYDPDSANGRGKNKRALRFLQKQKAKSKKQKDESILTDEELALLKSINEKDYEPDSSDNKGKNDRAKRFMQKKKAKDKKKNRDLDESDKSKATKVEGVVTELSAGLLRNYVKKSQDSEASIGMRADAAAARGNYGRASKLARKEKNRGVGQLIAKSKLKEETVKEEYDPMSRLVDFISKSGINDRYKA